MFSFSVNPSILIVGCQPAASPVMLESVKAGDTSPGNVFLTHMNTNTNTGHIVQWDSQETLSGDKTDSSAVLAWNLCQLRQVLFPEGSAGGIEDESITFPFCRRHKLSIHIWEILILNCNYLQYFRATCSKLLLHVLLF